jgi:hypothetical protein
MQLRLNEHLHGCIAGNIISLRPLAFQITFSLKIAPLPLRRYREPGSQTTIITACQLRLEIHRF